MACNHHAILYKATSTSEVPNWLGINWHVIEPYRGSKISVQTELLQATSVHEDMRSKQSPRYSKLEANTCCTAWELSLTLLESAKSTMYSYASAWALTRVSVPSTGSANTSITMKVSWMILPWSMPMIYVSREMKCVWTCAKKADSSDLQAQCGPKASCTLLLLWITDTTHLKVTSWPRMHGHL